MICPDFATPRFLIVSDTVPSLIYFSHLPAMITALLLGIFIFSKNRKLLLSKILLSISITFFLWVFFNLILWASNDSGINIFVWSFFGILYPLLYILSLYLFYVFVDKKDISFKMKVFLGTLILPLILLTPTKYNLSGFNLNDCGCTGGFEGKYFTNYYYLVGLFIFFWILFVSIKRLRKSEGAVRKQVLLFTIGIEFFLFSFFFTGYLASYLIDIGVVKDFSIEQYGLFGMIVFLGFLSYLILKYEAFDVKVIAAQFLIVTVWIAVFSQFFIVQERSNQILTGLTLALVTYFGWMLFRAVKEEVETGRQLSLAGRKLAGLNAKLEELDRAKSEFISIASHQLRTPLTSVKGFTSLILDNTFGKIPVGQKRSVEKIFVNNEKLCLLVEDMLNASRLEAGRLEYELEQANLIDVVKSTVDIISLYAKSKKIKLVANYPREIVLRAIIDQRKVAEIVSNLIDNAIKYTPKGSVTVTLEKFRKARRVGKMDGTNKISVNWARVSVTDTGIGMSEKQTEEIFEKFKEGSSSEVANNKNEDSSKPAQGDKAKNGNGNNNNMASGTGLGVYISRQMAQAMGGQLYATSPGKGKGSTFILELPLVKK